MIAVLLCALVAATLGSCRRRPEPVLGLTVAEINRARTLAAVAALPPCGPLPDPAAGWERRNPGPFSLQLPPAYREKDVRGIDSFVGRYEARGRRLSFDFGLYSPTLVEWHAHREFHACRDSVGGHLVKMVTARAPNGGYLAGATWRELGHGAMGPSHLTIYAEVRTAAQQQEALAVFRSVQFFKAQPRP